MDRTPLSASEYREIIGTQLVPMFAGSEFDGSPVQCDVDDPTLLSESDTAVLVRPDPLWPYCFRLKRKQPFERSDLAIIKNLLEAFAEKLVASNEPFFGHLVDICAEDAVARSVKHRSVDDSLLPTIIGTLRRWSSQTYEGNRISVAIAVDPSPDSSRISETHLVSLVHEDYAKVLSNGLDTIVVLSPSGHVVDYAAVGPEGSDEARVAEPWATPGRYLPLAAWASRNRVVFALNRHGEILVFAARRLRFAFRRGTWSHFSHNAMITRMGARTSRQKRLMRAVYATCLDVSFTRTGGCIAIARGAGASRLSQYLNDNDLLALGMTEKSQLFDHLIGLPFAGLPRSIREELAALDGAVVLDRGGTVLAVGAIVHVPGGSEGGGRRAAAKALSRLGLAIKVSADGAITAFSNRGTSADPEVLFEVCA